MRGARWSSLLWFGAVLGMAVLPLAQARGAERVQLTTGFSLDCVRHEVVAGDKVRLVMRPSAGDGGESYMDVARSEVASIELVPDRAEPMRAGDDAAGQITVGKTKAGAEAVVRGTELQGMLTGAEQRHRVDADLLASVVRAESVGRTHAVSRTGAQGLMQLMPKTAAQLGVRDSFAPEQNIEGGSSYLDALLTRYHDNLAFALAAYNAGPAAVDRFHGIPPFRETQLYVARVIREFNRRKLAVREASRVVPAAAAAMVVGSPTERGFAGR